MKLSSTTTARLYKGSPISYPKALLDKTKSPPRSFPCHIISPLILSTHVICIVSSILNLITEVLPWDMNVSISSFERFLCLLSCFGGNPLFFCSSLNAEISSSVVKHLYAAPHSKSFLMCSLWMEIRSLCFMGSSSHSSPSQFNPSNIFFVYSDLDRRKSVSSILMRNFPPIFLHTTSWIVLFALSQYVINPLDSGPVLNVFPNFF